MTKIYDKYGMNHNYDQVHPVFPHPTDVTKYILLTGGNVHIWENALVRILIIIYLTDHFSNWISVSSPQTVSLCSLQKRVAYLLYHLHLRSSTSWSSKSQHLLVQLHHLKMQSFCLLWPLYLNKTKHLTPLKLEPTTHPPPPTPLPTLVFKTLMITLLSLDVTLQRLKFLAGSSGRRVSSLISPLHLTT